MELCGDIKLSFIDRQTFMSIAMITMNNYIKIDFKP